MKKDVKALILWASVGLVGALCASCSNGRAERKAARLLEDNLVQHDSIVQLQDSIKTLREGVDINDVEQIFISFRKYENEVDEVGTLREDLRVERMSAQGEMTKWYVYVGTSIYEVDAETSMAVKYGDKEGLHDVRLFHCECGLWHALHK